MNTDFINVFLQDIKNNINGFIAVSITEIETGLSYGSLTNDKSFDAEIASIYNLDVVKAKFKAVQALGIDQEIKDILITLTSQIHIIDVSPNKKFMIYLVADSTKANLAMTRGVLKKYKGELEKNL